MSLSDGKSHQKVTFMCYQHPPRRGTARTTAPSRTIARTASLCDPRRPGACPRKAPGPAAARTRPAPTSVEAGFPAEQGGQVPGLRMHARQPVMAEPPADVLRVPGQKSGPARISDHVDHLRQVDHDQPSVVDQDVVRGQVAVRQPVAGQGDHRLHHLVPEPGELGRAGPGLGQPRRGRPVRRPDELQQQLGAEDLHRVRHGSPGRAQPGQRGELRPGPLACDGLPAERAPAGHRPVDPEIPGPASLQVAAAAADQEDVGLLAGLQDAELDVDRGVLGDQPVRVGLGTAFGRRGLVPGRPAIALWQAVGGVELLDRRQRPAPPDALGRGWVVVVETPLTAARSELSVVGGMKVGHGWCSSAEDRIGQAATRPRRAYTSGVSLPLSRAASAQTAAGCHTALVPRNRISRHRPQATSDQPPQRQATSTPHNQRPKHHTYSDHRATKTTVKLAYGRRIWHSDQVVRINPPPLGKLLPRHAEASVGDALTDTRVVLVNGARQSGKSTLVGVVAKGRHAQWRNLDNAITRQAAIADPVGFVDSAELMVVDEIQRVPDLLLAIKEQVDADPRPGRYLLTGSARLLALRGLPDTLAGRTETIELWPLAQGELDGTADRFIDAVFDRGDALTHESAVTRQEYAERIVRGGFPEAARTNPRR